MNKQQAEKLYNKGYLAGYYDKFYGGIDKKDMSLYHLNHVYYIGYDTGYGLSSEPFHTYRRQNEETI